MAPDGPHGQPENTGLRVDPHKSGALGSSVSWALLPGRLSDHRSVRTAELGKPRPTCF